MFYHIIASGSKGNCTYISNKDTRILIDMGISLVRLKSGLAEIGQKVSDIEGILYTHEHSDHISGFRFISPKKSYATEGTAPSTLCNIVEYNVSFDIGSFKITPFQTSHDAKKPCGYVIEDNESKLVYMTDTGVFLESNLPLLENPDYLIIESNHDMGMLMGSNRPMILKQRIKSDFGHLCNEDSAFATSKIIGTRTKEIVLAHLSEECNTEEHALNAYKDIFSYLNINLDLYNIKCAKQWESISGGNNEN